MLKWYLCNLIGQAFWEGFLEGVDHPGDRSEALLGASSRVYAPARFRPLSSVRSPLDPPPLPDTHTSSPLNSYHEDGDRCRSSVLSERRDRVRGALCFFGIADRTGPALVW